jgi:hypothetical protein
MYALAQAMLESERQDGAHLTIEHRNARTMLDTLHREQRARGLVPAPTPTPAPAPPPPAPAAPAGGYGAFAPHPYATYAGQRLANASGSSDGSGAAPAYAQYAGAGLPAAGMPLFTSAPMSSLGAGWSRTSSGSHSASPAPAPAPVAAAAAPVPVQLPASAVPALKELGIVPVPAGTLAPGAPRPQCVLAGVQQDGALLALEINIGSLSQPQRHGLAVLLGSIMTGRAPGVASAASTASAGQAGPSAATSPAASTSATGE